MKDILIIAHFIRGTLEGRFEYLANQLINKGCAVELVTTNFSHEFKKTRRIKEHVLDKFKFNLTMLHEPGYQKNISLRRFYSHYIMGRSLRKYLKERKKPDVIYCAVPSLDVAKAAAIYAKKNNIRFIIDIQDLWPEAFNMAFNIPIISKTFFYPIKRQADHIYAAADKIIAVSQTYVERAFRARKSGAAGCSIFLGAELDYFDELAEKNKYLHKPENEMWLAYIGTLGYSYDLNSVIDALKLLKDKGITNIKFVVMGDGPLKSEFERYAKKQGVYAEFTGKLHYPEMVGLLTACDIAVNPIKKDSAGSIINKVGDYAAAKLPVINTQECHEYRNLIDEYDSGLNCNNDDPRDLADKILILYSDEVRRKILSNNSRKLAEEKFDRGVRYSIIVDLITEE
jgi:glycosyltransferase involved in cell wall biosynthesis